MDFERYALRFARFMASPVYDPERDVVAAAPDGQIGAFCITWPDPLTGVGLFEPVGTHPDFQRKGLGKAVMLQALERLQRLGMRQAIVTTGEDNQPAIKLYEFGGFSPHHPAAVLQTEDQLNAICVRGVRKWNLK